MSQGIGVRMPVLVSAVVGASALACVIALAFVAPAYAQEETVEIDLGAPVYASTCRACHGEIAEGKNPQVKFSHAAHMLYACSSCHTVFPHSPTGTLSPTMKDCWNCHGLRHGPMGLIAADECVKCHMEYTDRMRPASHVPDWAAEPHVAPSLENLRTECMMCHTRTDCDECHRAEGVVWRTSEEFSYNVENGCLACHGDPTLDKSVADGVRSLYVSGLEDTAHRDNTCVDCHVDFVFDDRPAETPLWQVNAGLACGGCHEHSDIAEVYEGSLHGQLVAQGEYSSPTCGSCHGGHSIARLDTAAAQRQLFFAGEQMCGVCHPAEWENYDDYYHGRPYKNLASDAPACWGCHGSHEVKATTDPEAMMYPVNAVDVCGECHPGSSEAFIENSASLIHGRYDAVEANPVIRWWRSVRGRG